MVVHFEELKQVEVDRIFAALADATRRDIVVTVINESLSVSELADRYPMSFAAVQKHVSVLERAQLVSKTRSGRTQMVHSNIETIRRASRLLDHLESLWRGRLDRFGDLLAETTRASEPTTSSQISDNDIDTNIDNEGDQS